MAWETSSIKVPTNGTKTITFKTAGTYVDRDIKAIVENEAGTATLSASGSASATVPVSVGTKSGTSYPFSGSANITGTASASTTASGYATQGVTTGSGSVTGTAGVSGSMNAIGLSASATANPTISAVTVGSINSSGKYPISTGTVSVSGTATASVASTGYGTKGVETGTGNVTLGTASWTAVLDAAGCSVTGGSASGSNATAAISVSGMKTSTTATNYSVSVPATSATASIGAVNMSHTAGWLPAKDSHQVIAATSKTVSLGADTKYVVGASIGVKAGTATDLNNYTENTAAVVPVGGYLTIDEGYITNTKISLATLIPQDAAAKAAAASYIRSGYMAYDSDGALITGTMNDVTPTFTGGSVTVDKPSINVKTNATATIAESGTFVSSGSQTSYGVTTTKPTVSGQTLTDGTDYLTVDGTLDVTSGTVNVTAYANRSAVTYSNSPNGYISKTSGTSASAAPASKASATSDDTSVTVSKTDNFEPYYIPVVGGKASAAVTGAGGAVTATASGTVKTNGAANVSVTGTFKDSTTYGVTTTKPSSGTDGTNYLTITSTPTKTDGVVTAKADASRGAVTYSNGKGVIAAHSGASLLSSANATQNTKDITATVTAGSANNMYIPVATRSASLAASSGSGTYSSAISSATIAGTGYIAPTLYETALAATKAVNTSATAAGVYVTITPSASASASASATPRATTTAGAVTSGTTDGTATAITVSMTSGGNTAKYMAVYQGAYTVA